jgi:hypothetical protein
MAKKLSPKVKESYEDADLLLQIGKEGKEGRKYAKEHFDEEAKKEKQAREAEKELLNEHRRRKLSYNKFLAKLLFKRLGDVGLPQGWYYRVSPTGRGVVMEIESPDKRIFRTAFASVGQEHYDLNAVDTFVIRVEDLIDHIDSKEKRTKGGIWLPN